MRRWIWHVTGNTTRMDVLEARQLSAACMTELLGQPILPGQFFEFNVYFLTREH